MKKRILVVDDEQDIVSMLRMRLEAAGYEVSTASDGEEGLARATEAPPDLMILDILMPKMDGIAMSDALKKNPRTRNIPVLFLTALKRQSDGGASGPNLIFSKPFSGGELTEKISEILGT
ncbi:MAG: response regulator [Candidatus Omnitrophica bacterium]|nr:response regulator [Candidatus Omnitrophota bacterium]